MKRSKVGSFLLSLVLVEVAGCGGPDGSGTTQPETPRATTITISPSSVTLSLLDATRPLTATVRDQNGQTFSGTVAWSRATSLWSSGEGTGLVRALKNGTATVTARSGSVSATVAVTVRQAAVLLVVISGDAHSCIERQRTIQSVVDDIRIYVSFDSIDGLGGTLGQAGPCIIRTKTGFPVVGAMQFDRQDLENRFLTPEVLLPLILHEMGHVLGIGTMRGLTIDGLVINDLLRNPCVGIGNAGSDTHFVRPLAIAAFDAAGGTSHTGGEKVPVENNGMVGSADAHWRESVLGNELMTSGLNPGSNPLSAITIQSLADVGYRVDVGPADFFSPVFTVPALARE